MHMILCEGRVFDYVNLCGDVYDYVCSCYNCVIVMMMMKCEWSIIRLGDKMTMWILAMLCGDDLRNFMTI